MRKEKRLVLKDRWTLQGFFSARFNYMILYVTKVIKYKFDILFVIFILNTY